MKLWKAKEMLQDEIKAAIRKDDWEELNRLYLKARKEYHNAGGCYGFPWSRNSTFHDLEYVNSDYETNGLEYAYNAREYAERHKATQCLEVIDYYLQYDNQQREMQKVADWAHHQRSL